MKTESQEVDSACVPQEVLGTVERLRAHPTARLEKHDSEVLVVSGSVV
jgi:hypothetical protein